MNNEISNAQNNIMNKMAEGDPVRLAIFNIIDNNANGLLASIGTTQTDLVGSINT